MKFLIDGKNEIFISKKANEIINRYYPARSNELIRVNENSKKLEEQNKGSHNYLQEIKLIVHDFNNILQIIRGNTELFLNENQYVENVRLENICQSIDEAGDLIQQLQFCVDKLNQKSLHKSD